MSQSVLQFVHAHALFFGMVIGAFALVLILVGDFVKKRAYYPKPGVFVSEVWKEAAGAICLGFNIGGFIMFVISVVIMAWGGCYDQLLGKF